MGGAVTEPQPEPQVFTVAPFNWRNNDEDEGDDE